MSNRRGCILEIAGHSAAYASHAGAPASWATTIRRSILSVPRGSTLSVDIDTYKADTGGTQVNVTDASAELLHRSDSAVTALTQAHTAAVTTLTVADTSSFASSGTVWVGQEAITYSGKTATTFTGCSRAQLGTDALPHGSGAVVYSYAPSLLGRKCVLTWYDQDDTAFQSIRYTGYIDSLDFSDSGYTLSIVSSKKKFEDTKALTPQIGKGRLVSGSVLEAASYMEVEFDDESEATEFITAPAGSPNWPYYYVRIDDELLRYTAADIRNPAYTDTVGSVTSAYEIDLASSAQGFWPGRSIEFLSGGLVAARGIILTQSGLTLTHSAGYSPSGGDVVRIPGVAIISNPQRGALFTRQEVHESPSDVAEYRVVEGNHVDCLLWLMLSRAGDKANSDYDILPDGWGAGIPSNLIDLDAFEQIVKPRATWRRYVLDEQVDILEWLGRLAIVTNTRIYWGTDGILTAIPISDQYPLAAANATVDKSNLVRGQIPQLRIDQAQIRNVWEFPSDYDLDGDHRAVMRVEITESIGLYGELAAPRMEDKGMRAAEHNGISYAIARAALKQRSLPLTVLTVQILFQENVYYTPGMRALVTIPHLPNMQGGRGLEGAYFEITSYSPQEDQGTAELVLVQLQSPNNLGHVAPVCVVESIDGNDITVRARTWSKYAPPIISYPVPGNGGYDGTEDVHWFLADDAVRFVDVSTLGNATPTTGDTTISSIDYPNRVVTVASAPGFLAAGDLMRLDLFPDVLLSSTVADRQDIFIALADESTLLIDSSAPYRWGL